MTIQQRLEWLRARRSISSNKKKSFRAYLRSREGRAEIWRNAERAAEYAAQPRLDFRGTGYEYVNSQLTYTPWVKWEPGLPFNIGSGRAAEWCHVAFERYALTCRLIHEHLGWSGATVRRVAKALCSDMGFHWQPPAECLPVREIVRIAALPRLYPGAFEAWSMADYATSADPEQHRRAQWLLWIARVQRPAWGAYMLAHERARLARDPNYHTPSGLVGEIRRLRGDSQPTDLRGCSGCEYLSAAAQLSAEEQDQLLARAKKPQLVTLKGGLQGLCVPFGLPYPTDYDHCLILGLSYEIRVRSADYKALTPDQLTAALR